MRESEQHSRPRLFAALLVYGLIALLAAFTLEGKFRIAVWIFIGGLAVRTWLAWAHPHR